MNRDIQNNFKDLFPPTPAAFTRRVGEALKALPERGARWRLPVPAVAGYAAAACVAVALILTGVILPAGSASTAVRPEGNANADAEATSAAASLPPAGPLPQLAVTNNAKAPASADGWQAAALAGDVTWYYRPAKGDLAVTKEGKTTVVALDVALGQAVDPYTFLPGQEGRWLAFTVHESGGDKVWLVTGDGRKMVVPDDVRWVLLDQDPKQSIDVDLGGAKMVPYCNQTVLLTPLNYTHIEANGESLSMIATFADGFVYRAEVALDWIEAGQAQSLSDRRGILYCYPVSTLNGISIFSSKYVFYTIDPTGDGKYRFDMRGYQVSAPLQSNQFSLIKPVGEEHGKRPYSALFIYRDDPAHALWKINLISGELTKVTEDCLSAGWVDKATYWFATGKNPAAIQKQKAGDLDQVLQTVLIMPSVNMSDNNTPPDRRVMLTPQVIIHNNADCNFILPVSVPCSLTVKKDGAEIWSVRGSYTIGDGADVVGNYSQTTEGQDPIQLKYGEYVSIGLAEIPYRGPGTYTLEGNFNNGPEINIPISLPSSNISGDIRVSGNLDIGKRLSVTVFNNSHGDVCVPQPYEGAFPPTVYYRLFSGSAELESGTLKMAAMQLKGIERIVPTGGSRTLIETGDIPKLSTLPKGVYRLKCMLEYSTVDSMLPEGFGLGYPFEVKFLINDDKSIEVWQD